MQTPIRKINTDLAIIGTGLAGTAAAVFARNRNIACAIAGNTGALAYTTGYFDLLGYCAGDCIDNPWEALDNLRKTSAGHPLAAIDQSSIRRAFTDFISFIASHGIGYSHPGEKNRLTITPAGTLKPTLCLPSTMEKGVEALENKGKCTLIGFHGLKGFSARQIAANLADLWPGLQARLVGFPGHHHGELYAEVAARSLEVPGNRKLLADIINMEAGASSYIGLPAILGIHAPDRIHQDLEDLTGRRLFEIPTMPPSVAGIRLREMFEQNLPGKTTILVPQQKIDTIAFDKSDVIELQLSDNFGPIEIKAKTALLATGRFLSGGLRAHFDHVDEPLAGLSVYQPPSREEWYQQEYLDNRGHEIHLAGIETDSSMRPLAGGKVVDERLFAAGIILAHQDWIRQRCGAGVALATAYKAVQAIGGFLGK